MNIKEIAELAGVSAAAVSRYLNNGYLSEEKKQQIEKVIKETGYVPSQQAKTLRTGRTKLVGVIIPKIDSDSISRIVAGISEVLTEAGYQMILANTENDSDREIGYLSLFKQTNVDGIIHLGTLQTPKHQKAFRKLELPHVVLGQQSKSASCVYHDDYQAMFALTEYAIAKGHKHFAYIGVTEKDIAVGQQRKKGFTEALTKAKISIEKTPFYEGSFQMDNGYENAKNIIRDHKRTDCIICATDTIALGVIKYLNEKKIPIPQQIGIAGLGDSRAASILSPSLTTVHFYYKECGIEGAKILLDQIEHPDAPKKVIKLDFKIIENESL